MTIRSNTNKYFFKYSIIKPGPGIEIRYSHISDLTNFVLSEKKYSSNFNKVQRGVFFKQNDFIPEFFSHEELKTINGFKAFKKQIEWMSGRCLIKYIVLNFLIHSTSLLHFELDFNDTSIDINEINKNPSIAYLKNNQINDQIRLNDIIISHHGEGAPFLKNWPFLKISISHSGKYAAAALCMIRNKEIGLDIEKIGEMPDSSFMKIAFTEQEIADMQHYPENNLKCPEEIFKKWTIKEAFLKYIQKGFNESLHRVEILEDHIFHNGKKVDVSIFSTIIGNHTRDMYSLSIVS